MRKNQLVQHRGECLLQRIIFYKKHVAPILIFDMGVAAPRDVFVIGAAMNPALEGVAALTADDLAGESISVLVFIGAFCHAFFGSPLTYKNPCSFKILTTDDRFVMIRDHVLRLLTVIVVSDKL